MIMNLGTTVALSGNHWYCKWKIDSTNYKQSEHSINLSEL